MKAQHVFRPNQQSPEERARERELRDRLQQEKPSLEDLILAGNCDPDDVMTLGMYCDVQKALQNLKRERERRGISICDVCERSGLDQALVSKLENGQQANPTVAVLMRYAAAVGKRFLWAYEDLTTKAKKGERMTPEPNNELPLPSVIVTQTADATARSPYSDPVLSDARAAILRKNSHRAAGNRLPHVEICPADGAGSRAPRSSGLGREASRQRGCPEDVAWGGAFHGSTDY